MLSYPDAWIYQIGEQGLERVDYKQTEHFELTRRFLNHPERYLQTLLD